MNYINPICIIFFVFLIFSCESKEKEGVNENSSDDLKITNALTDPTLEEFITKMIDEEHFKGIVLAASDNQLIHAKGYGLANDTLKNTVHTKFHVASITKQFTAAAIMQLLEQKKINLEGSINNYLPANYRSEVWNVVNIHHLLSHSSGIEDYAVTREYYEVEKGFCLGNTVDGMIKEAMDKELNFPPGSKFSYSNIGYTLLGEIIENITGEAYPIYMKEKILEPLEMYSSFIHTSDYVAANDEAIGYRWDEDQNKHVLDDIVSLPVTEPDGNLVTTLNDFLKWTAIYYGDPQDILNEESIKKMTTPYTQDDELGPNDKAQMYGYGLSLTDSLISHSGYIVGFRSHFIVDRAQNIRVFVFNNNVSNNPKNVSKGIYSILKVKKDNEM